MVYCRASTTHLQAIDSTEGCVAARGTGNCNEIGIIPVGDNGGMVQVQMQLVALTIQLEELTKGKGET
jgi:hypothetical protein